MNEFCIPPDSVIELNRTYVGDEFNVLDHGKLEGALAAPLRTFGGQLLVKSPLERTAMLIERVTNAHAFVDANKRTAWLCGVAYLELNGFVVSRSDDLEVADFMEDVANNEMNLNEIASWLASRFA